MPIKISNFIAKSIIFIKLTVLSLTTTQAQIIPDQTLGDETSTVTPGQTINGVPRELIQGGSIRGENLFHSFQEFNINEGASAYFTNPTAIHNIFTRVTGASPSNILGTLGVLGEANLFFINPNGIIFGSQASLDLNGAFLGTTASSILFEDGTIFSASNPKPMVTISVPVGLGFGEIPGKIQIKGQGHNIFSPSNVFLPNIALGPILQGLAVKTGQTLALIGGEVSFEGGIVTAPSGHIEIGSVEAGQVRFTFSSQNNLAFKYDKVSLFNDIDLTRQSLINASGIAQGTINVFGQNITLTDASLIFLENRGTEVLDRISINASESLTLIGITENSPILSSNISPFQGTIRPTSGLNSQALLGGKGADINITAKNLVLDSSGRIYLSSFNQADGGNLKINVSELIEIGGISPFEQNFVLSSLISTATSGTGRAGDINLNTKNLIIREGGQLNSTVFNEGLGGNLTINVSDSIFITGFNKNSLLPSIISSVILTEGSGGNLTLDTQKLILKDGGRVSSTTFGPGDAGSLTISASDSIEVKGIIPGSVNPSLIDSSANRVDPIQQELLQLPERPSGASGSISISTNSLRVNNGGRVSVNHEGIGSAGNLTINANSININNAGSITATTEAGEGGNISIKSQDIRLSNSSAISATAGGLGNGGNIEIDTDFLVLFGDSSITANAFAGRGGNINIIAQGLFVSPNAQITASSELGIDGTVRIQELETRDQFSAIQTIDPFRSTDSDLAKSCLADSASRGTFKYTGSSGLPLNPASGVDNATIIKIPQPSEDFTSSQGNQNEGMASDQSDFLIMRSESDWQLGDPIVEATARVRTADGRILLVSEPPEEPYEILEVICHFNAKRHSNEN